MGHPTDLGAPSDKGAPTDRAAPTDTGRPADRLLRPKDTTCLAEPGWLWDASRPSDVCRWRGAECSREACLPNDCFDDCPNESCLSGEEGSPSSADVWRQPSDAL